MKKIYLVRHGQSHSNAGGEAMINADIPLTELGQHQAEQVAYWLYETLGDNIDSIMVSKFLRTHQTAKPLVDKLGITPTIVEGLQEFDYLSFAKIDGTTLEERRQMAEDYWLTHSPDEMHGGDAETYHNFCGRVEQVLAYFRQLPTGNHVAFTHGLWISMLIWQILGQTKDGNRTMQKFVQFERPIRTKNCEVFCLTLLDDNDVINGIDAMSLPPMITKVRSLNSID
ncbi:histidine phosphatase family protein [Psychrobacter sp. I-STPA6b]|uniref:histidine phosphatase family protein n=1 Tax=Psychrobacter sp. I-STPA6b TaxID=2585718 RepID=UPI001D0C1199|nr:histidine phosphatase family protein [Psychrobacter sp. I-STPA6b]